MENRLTVNSENDTENNGEHYEFSFARLHEKMYGLCLPEDLVSMCFQFPNCAFSSVLILVVRNCKIVGNVVSLRNFCPGLSLLVLGAI